MKQDSNDLLVKKVHNLLEEIDTKLKEGKTPEEIAYPTILSKTKGAEVVS